MKSTILTVVGCTLLLPTISFGGDPYIDIHDTMCTEGEAIYISCSFNANEKNKIKVASICAKGNESPDSGYIQYRYGIPGEKLELQFPKSITSPKKIFKIYKSDSIDGITQALRFSKETYIYSFEKRGLSSYRLVVTENGKEVFNKSCEEPGKIYIADDAFDGIQTINLGEKEISNTDK
ncbi:hypothetical protein KRX52_16200 [Pseudomonas sp. MAP12]|uniref:Uncharacterized protein n=1 Tax=Geopseudomonas aromaticivorans TaxID=2849492 RepID=A0ABS6MZT4_9GAMM|nr:hypothetical protein [Pseudomonas aromaticivorans]MBV2134322.1 hypothetical protein [Pseudomonas aromaticivorans]